MTPLNLRGFELLVDWTTEEDRVVINDLYCNTWPTSIQKLYETFPTYASLEEEVCEALLDKEW